MPLKNASKVFLSEVWEAASAESNDPTGGASICPFHLEDEVWEAASAEPFSDSTGGDIHLSIPESWAFHVFSLIPKGCILISTFRNENK